MAENIRQLVRYEIPGYICIVCALLLLLPFVDLNWLQKNTDLIQILGIILTLFISGIPLGWILFQIYATSIHDRVGRRVWQKPRKLLQNWDQKESTPYKFRDHLMDYALVRTGLQLKAQIGWAHASARIVVGFLVPIGSLILAPVIFFLASLSQLSDVFYSNDLVIRSLHAFTIWFILTFVLLFFVYRGTGRIHEEIEKYIIIALLKNEEDIKGIIQKRKDAEI